MLKISSSGTSNAGKKKINEDNFYMNGVFAADDNAASGRIYSDNTQRDVQFYAVFDGLGDDITSDLNPNIDFRDGEKASSAAAEMLSRLQRHLKTKEEYNLNEYIYRFVKKTNGNLCEYMKQSKLWTGTSFALLCINGDTAYAYNIGNSKIFLLRDNRINLVTKNDTKAESLVMAKQISADIVRHAPENKALTQYLGAHENDRNLNMHINKINLRNGDKFLICTDGLCDLASERIYQILSRDISEQEIVTDLINEATRSGGAENLTAVAVGVNYSDGKSAKSSLLKTSEDGTAHFGPLTFRKKFEFKPKHIRHIIFAAAFLVVFIVSISLIFSTVFKSPGGPENPTGESGNGTSANQTSDQNTTEKTTDVDNTGNTMATTTGYGADIPDIPTWDNDFDPNAPTTAGGNTPAITTDVPVTTEPPATDATTEAPALTEAPATTAAPATEATTEAPTEIPATTTAAPTTETPTEAPITTAAPTTTAPTTEAPTAAPVTTEPPTEAPTPAPAEAPTEPPAEVTMGD